MRYGGPSPYSEEARARRSYMAKKETVERIIVWGKFLLLFAAVLATGVLGGFLYTLVFKG